MKINMRSGRVGVSFIVGLAAILTGWGLWVGADNGPGADLKGAHKLYDPAKPIEQQPGAVALDGQIETIAVATQSTAEVGGIELGQWTGDTKAGTRNTAGNTIVWPTGALYFVTLTDWDIREGGLLADGQWHYYPRLMQDAQLRFGYLDPAVTNLPVTHGTGFGLQGVFPYNAIVMCLPFRIWTGSGDTVWQTGFYSGNPLGAGLWEVAAGKTLSQAQQSTNNRIGRLDFLQEIVPALRPAFKLQVDTGGVWQLMVDVDQDGQVDIDWTSEMPGNRRSTFQNITPESGLFLTTTGPAGIRSGRVGRGPMSLVYEAGAREEVPNPPRNRRPLDVTIPVYSYVSPLTVEGKRWSSSYTVAYTADTLPSAATPNYLDTKRFVASVPLSPSNVTHMTFTQSGQPPVEVTGTTEWIALDLAQLDAQRDSIAVRKGESLLLTVNGAGSVAQIDLNGDGIADWTGAPGDRLIASCDQLGAATVTGRIDGQPAGSVHVTVVGVRFPARILAPTGVECQMPVDVGNVDASMLYTFGSSDSNKLSVRFINQIGSRAIVGLRPSAVGDVALEVRFASDNSLVGAKAVTNIAFTFTASSELVINTGTGIGRPRMTMTPYVANIGVGFKMYASQSTFANGETDYRISGTDIVEHVENGNSWGEAVFDMEVAAWDLAYCFAVKMYEPDLVWTPDAVVVTGTVNGAMASTPVINWASPKNINCGANGNPCSVNLGYANICADFGDDQETWCISHSNTDPAHSLEVSGQDPLWTPAYVDVLFPCYGTPSTFTCSDGSEGLTQYVMVNPAANYLPLGVYNSYIDYTCYANRITVRGVKNPQLTVDGEISSNVRFGQTGILRALHADFRPLEWKIIKYEPDVKNTRMEVGTNTQNDLFYVTPKIGSGYVTVSVNGQGHLFCGDIYRFHVGCEPCAPCGGNNQCPKPGRVDPKLNCVEIDIGLGRGLQESHAGNLRIFAGRPNVDLATPGAIILPWGHPNDVPVVRNSDVSFRWPLYETITQGGVPRQIMADDALVDISVDNPHRYVMKFYLREAVGWKDGDGIYQISGSPCGEVTVENPGADINHLRITRQVGSNTEIHDYTWSPSDQSWTLVSGDGLRKQVRKESNNGLDILTTVSDAAGVVASEILEKNQFFPWGTSLVQRVTDPSGLALAETYAYHTSGDGLGHVSRIDYPDTSWTEYDYVKIKGVAVTAAVRTPHKNGGIREVLYDYTPHAGETCALRDYDARTVTETIDGQPVSRTYTAYYQVVSGDTLTVVSERAATPASAFGDPANLRTVSTYASELRDQPEGGRLMSVLYPDGRTTTNTYEFGELVQSGSPDTWTFAPNVAYSLKRTATHGTTNNIDGIACQTTRDVTIENDLGDILMRETYVYTGTDYERTAWTAYQLDEFGQTVETCGSDGTQVSTVWGCCGKESEISADGVRTVFFYDALKRLDTVMKEAADPIFTQYIYNAAGRTLLQRISAAALSLFTTNTYDGAGRLIASQDEAGLVTTHAYTSGGRIVTTTRPGGATVITENYLDGRPMNLSGTAVVPSTMDYGANSDGTTWQTTYTGPGGTASPNWTKTTTDFMGRTLKQERPGFGAAILATEYIYNTKGQLVRLIIPGHAPTLYEYDQLARQIASGLDVDLDNTLDRGQTDRVTENDFHYEKTGGDWFGVSIAKLYPDSDSARVLTNSITRIRLTGLNAAKTSEIATTDRYGAVTISSTSVNRTAKTRTSRTDTPESTQDRIAVTVNGLLVSTTTGAGLTYLNTYDPLERNIGTTDPRTGSTLTHYAPDGRVDYVEDAAGNRTTFIYDPATGRRIVTLDSLLQATHVEYDAKDRVIGTWGATYPVFYQFDAYGRMSAMYTLRDTNVVVSSYADFLAQQTLFDKTAWLYDDATGLFTNKLHANNKGPAYTYTPDGKLSTRTWARTVTTTYTYTPAAGQLLAIAYSDGTPAVSFQYDRIGMQLSASAQGVSTNLFDYDPLTLDLTNETVWTAFAGLHAIARPHDSLGRPVGYTLLGPDLAAAPSAVSTYGYDPLGRFASITSVVNSATTTVAYAYLPDSHLLFGTTVTPGGSAASLTVSRAYESNRDLLLTVTNLYSGGIVSAFDYSSDAVGRRTNRIDLLSGVPGVRTNAFGYNPRSELVSAGMDTNSFGYSYDSIGNRITGGTAASPSAYVANELNQYVSIVNDVTQTPTYDDDGNMTYLPSTTGGGGGGEGWYFQWDAENRLISAGNGALAMSFAYDHQSRRIAKIVGSATNAFLYNGWAMISEVGRGVPAAPSYTNTFVYGLDLSGTLQGAGTIGGIVAMHSSLTSTLFYAFDGNGNVTDLIDTNGAIVAHYEYDPYGNVLSSTGALASINPFRFSSKYQDDETGLVYFGFRYFSPELGRWISKDPMGERGGLNLYSAFGNDAVDYVDPLGLAVRIVELGDSNGRLAKMIAKYKDELRKIKKDVEGIPDDEFSKADVEWNDAKFIGNKKQFIALIDYEISQTVHITGSWKHDFDQEKRDFENTLDTAFPEKVQTFASGNITLDSYFFFVAHGDEDYNSIFLGPRIPRDKPGAPWYMKFDDIRKRLSTAADRSNRPIVFVSCYSNKERKPEKIFIASNDSTADFNKVKKTWTIRIAQLGRGDIAGIPGAHNWEVSIWEERTERVLQGSDVTKEKTIWPQRRQ